MMGSTVTLLDEFDMEYEVEVDFDVQPAEYEDGYCFFGGAVEINECWRDGKPYNLSEQEYKSVCEQLSEHIPKDYYRGDFY